MDATEHLMRRAAVVAARVLAELWPDGRAVVDIEDVSSMNFVVSGRHDGTAVHRTGEVMGSALWDVVDLGKLPPVATPSSVKKISNGVFSVGLPRRRLRRLRPVHWSETEVEDLCRSLNAVDAMVIGTERTF